MVLDRVQRRSLSAAFFCPQSTAPDKEYLAGLHSFLRQNHHGQVLLLEVCHLDKVWPIFANSRDDVHGLSQGPVYIDILRRWAETGESSALAAVRSGIIALPLLVILQIGQYLRYLEYHKLAHHAFVAEIRQAGGVQGYCGGLPAAMAVACAKDEMDVVNKAAITMRVLLGVGAYAEAADDTNGTGSTTLALRLKFEGQGTDLTRRFPGTHVSAITDPKSISIVGSAARLDELFNYARGQGLQVQKMDIRGKCHNPENVDLSAELSRLCHETPCLQLPSASQLQTPIRSNKTGQQLLDCSLTEEIVTTILASKCDWYSLLHGVAADLKRSERSAHECVIFGLNDCVPMSPFHRKRLQTTKSKADSLITRIHTPHDPKFQPPNVSFFQDSGIAVVGASCRLPGASNLEELWNLLANGIDRHQEVPSDRFDLHGSFRASQSGGFASERKFYGNFLDDVGRFDHAFFGVNAREAANMDPQQRLLLELSYEALEASGYLSTHRREAGDNVGCFIGASLVEYLDNTNAHGPTAYTSTGTIRAFLCGRLSHNYGWCGPSEVIDTACSSSLVAINRACKAILTGECNMALTGGVNIITGINNYLDLGKAGFLSPAGQCKPFDVSADGYCRSDGAGLVVLKRLKQAVSDGDQILGIIAGVATNQGGLSASITVPYPPAQQTLYRNVMKQSGLQPEQVTYVETHGTGTQAGDPLEMESVRSIFGSSSRSDTIHIGSIKGNIGHCETAAGVASLLKVLAMLKHGQLPPQANHQRLNPKIPPLEPDGLAITQGLQPWDVPFRAALVNSYGAAGSNCALLCCEMPRQGHQDAEKLRTQNGKISFPIMLSAASQKSLLDQSRTLGSYLRQVPAGCKIGDVSLTLKKRQRHKYCVATVSGSVDDLVGQLLSFEPSAFFESVQTSKQMVLSFSGQSSDKVALDKTIYESYPAFRSYIDACDAELRSLGFPSIVPAIFRTQPIDDVTILQCSMFAMQYASANCWIDAGLKISAVVGHSLGELTALAVSGALSLSDGIKLVASRARLIQDNWGLEKGAMLALQCGIADFDKISKHLQRGSEDGKLEIACYNSQTSLVIVGTSAAIDATEKLVRTEPSLQEIRCKRLETSHGFHSALVEPILADLAVISTSLHWNEPKIPIEVCTKKRLRSMLDYEVCRHAREPVFFSNAVSRLEESLGPCTWLEAGLDTPIIPMLRKALKHPEIHDFHAIKVQGSRGPTRAISDVVASLWKSGVPSDYWSFVPGHGGEYKQIWLPPYAFEKTLHWRENIDRTIEMRQTLLNRTSDVVAEDKLSAPARLVTRKETTAVCSGMAEFIVNTQSERFRTIVNGHAVRQRPLCPASMYMECVIMAIQLLIGDTGNASLAFECIDYHAPLGLSSNRTVVIQLRETSDESSWKFTLRSSIPIGPKPKQTSHASGTISLVSDPDFDTFQRLLSSPVERLERDRDAEKFMSKRAYKLFSSVVDYGSFFQGIRSITLDGGEAVATISLPDNQPNREESTSCHICDTVTIDAFIQVIGLLMNSSDAVSREEVLVMSGLARAVISPGCKMDDSNSWQVYAKFGFSQESQTIGDVFVSSSEGKLVAMLCGCKFTKLLQTKLEKTLDLANPRLSQEVPDPAVKESLDGSSTTREDIDTPLTATPSLSGNDEALSELIAEYTGANKSDIIEDTIFADLGLDSLASVELVGELFSKFGLVITSDDLITSTLNDLNQRLGISNSGAANAGTTRDGTRAQSKTKRIEDSFNELTGHASEQRRQQFLQILVEVSGARSEDIEPPHELADLGVDSLSLVDLKQELEDAFSVRLDEFMLTCTVKDIMAQLSIGGLKQDNPDVTETPVQTGKVGGSSAPITEGQLVLPNPFNTLMQTDTHFNTSASKQGFLCYWSDVAPFQDELLLAYIIEGFSTLGVNISQLPPGSILPELPQLARKHDKLVQRLWEILQKHDIVRINELGNIVRGGHHLKLKPSLELSMAFQAQFPSYKHEVNLMNLTGPRLANCLSGKVDPVSIMFGSPASLKIMENFYGQSPMMSTLTEQLVIFITSLLRDLKNDRPVRVLEVGAGTGGTTKRLAEALDSAGITTQYTFTDISPSLVAKAKNKFKQYPWMEFATFNLEREVTDTFRNQFDIVVSANCVHATTDRQASCRRLREVLVQDGLIVLSEVTRIIDWYDICFGLLDGWWLAKGRKAYPLQPAEAWMSTFNAAGFASAGYSGGPTPEANSQQLLVACTKQWDMPASMPVMPENQSNQGGAYKIETVVYKEVSDVQIHADIFFPKKILPSPMPIALMIHGGGHMTLSRKAIRPFQTQHLLANGFLPVSVDYRLCPEVNLIDGPMTDVCDAYKWARTTLPLIAAQYGVAVNGNKVVVIGWSSGGHLALSIGWTANMANITPPTAVLSFYAPVDFESGELDVNRLSELPAPSISMERIITALPKTPITNYDSIKTDSTGLGWVRPGDPRSELVLYLFKEGIGLPLLLDGLPNPRTPSSEWFAPPSSAQVAAISPLAQLRQGTYNIPTYIIHGTLDQIAPFAAAERYVIELQKSHVRHGFLSLQGVDHIHDLRLKPGSREWEEQIAPGYQFLFNIVGD